MTNETKTVIDNVDHLAEVFNTRNVTVLDNTFLFNYQLLHPKMLDIFTKILKFEQNNDLNAIVICPTGPGDRYGEYFKHERIMTIYLDYTLTETFAAIETKRPEFGISPAIWINLIFTFCHELHHNVAFSTDWEVANGIDEEILDKQADEWAMHMLEEVQRTMDAEPPAIAQLPWFGTRIMQHMIERIQGGAANNVWLKQKEMSDAGLIFNKGDDKYTSLREYYKDSSTREIWENEGAELELKTTTDIFDQATIAAETVMAKPVTEQMALIKTLQTGEAIVDQTSPIQTNETDFKAGQEMVNKLNTAFGVELDPEDLAEMDMVGQLSEPTTEEDEAFNQIMTARPTGPTGVPDTFPNIPRKSNIVNQLLQEEPKTINEAARAMWMTLYNHMFTKCGWQNGTFTNPRGAYLAAPISKDPITTNMVHKSYTINEQNQPIWVPCINGVHGRTFVKGTIPGYDLELNCNEQKTNIRLIVQNPAKTSQYAQRARQGDRIAWIINQTSNEYVGLIDNGIYHTRVNGKWTVV